MWHGDWINGLCLYCHRVCYHCNQCKCEIKRKRVCPGFDTKKEPEPFKEWQKKRERDLESERERWREVHYGPRRYWWSQYEDLFSKINPDGTAYYDR